LNRSWAGWFKPLFNGSSSLLSPSFFQAVSNSSHLSPKSSHFSLTSTLGAHVFGRTQSRWCVAGTPPWLSSAVILTRFKRNIPFHLVCLIVPSPRGVEALVGLRGRDPRCPLNPLARDVKRLAPPVLAKAPPQQGTSLAKRRMEPSTMRSILRRLMLHSSPVSACIQRPCPRDLMNLRPTSVQREWTPFND
jgi:hypothetical protein